MSMETDKTANNESILNSIASEDAQFNGDADVQHNNSTVGVQVAKDPRFPAYPPVMPMNGPPMMPFVPETWREPPQNNLYVKNIAFDITEEKLKEIFSPYGEIVSIRIMRNEGGESKGFGFVCFQKVQDAVKAKYELHGYMLQKKPLYVNFAQKKAEREKKLYQLHSNQPALYGPPFPGYPNYATLPPEYFARQSMIPPYPSPIPPFIPSDPNHAPPIHGHLSHQAMNYPPQFQALKSGPIPNPGRPMPIPVVIPGPVHSPPSARMAPTSPTSQPRK